MILGRATQKCIHNYMSKNIDYPEKQDPEIQAEIDKDGSDNIRIMQ